MLLAAREKRVKPGRDDKVLVDWNGLMIASLANAGSVFSQSQWVDAARRAFRFICDKLGEGDKLFHSYRAGQRQYPALCRRLREHGARRSRFVGSHRRTRLSRSRDRVDQSARRAILGHRPGRICLLEKSRPARASAHAHRVRHTDAVGERHHGRRAWPALLCHRRKLLWRAREHADPGFCRRYRLELSADGDAI